MSFTVPSWTFLAAFGTPLAGHLFNVVVEKDDEFLSQQATLTMIKMAAFGALFINVVSLTAPIAAGYLHANPLASRYIHLIPLKARANLINILYIASSVLSYGLYEKLKRALLSVQSDYPSVPTRHDGSSAKKAKSSSFFKGIKNLF